LDTFQKTLVDLRLRQQKRGFGLLVILVAPLEKTLITKFIKVYKRMATVFVAEQREGDF
jgi:hypothetical protein